MEDITKSIQEDNFDHIKWVDSLLNTRPSSESIESYLTSTLTNLQVISQDLSHNVQLTMQQLTRSLPQAQTQIQKVESRTNKLFETLHNSQEEFNVSGLDTNHAIDILMKLESTKLRMQKCCEALKESAKWSQNVREVNNFFLHGKLDDVSEKLYLLKNSLKVLSDMSGYEERLSTMKCLCDKLENMIQPKLLEALNENKQFELGKYVKVYENLDRLDVFINHYTQSKQSPIHRFWYSFDASESSFEDWLPQFYEETMSILEAEKRSTDENFGNLKERLLEKLIDDAFDPLVDSFHDRIEESFTFDSMLQCYESTGDFLRKCRKKIFHQENSKNFQNFLKVAYKPYKEFFLTYDQREADYLYEEISKYIPQIIKEDNIQEDEELPEDGKDSSDGVLIIQSFGQQLEENAEEISELFELALKRCMKWTCGSGFPRLRQAYQQTLNQFSVSLVSLMPLVRSHCGMETKSTTHVVDWSCLQAGLGLFRAYGKLKQELNRIEADIHIQMRESLSDLLSQTEKDVLPASIEMQIVKEWISNDIDTKHSIELLHRDLSQSLHNAIFESGMKSLDQWKFAVQQFTYDVVLHPIQSILGPVPEFQEWGMQGDTEFDNDLPSFSTHPQEYITTVADLLLSLLPQLEPFAVSDGIENAMESMNKDGMLLSESAWKKVCEMLQLSQAEIDTFLISNITYMNNGDIQRDEEDRITLQFVDLWTNIVASGALACLLTTILEISTLSNHGCKQLLADLEYFENVLTALGVDIPLCIFHLIKVLKMSIDDLKQVVQQNEKQISLSSKIDDINGFQHKLDRIIARKRGILVTFDEPM